MRMAAQGTGRASPRPPGESVTVADLLVVEDDRDIAEALSDLLVSLGHQVRVAHDGKEGLQRVEERFPDLVLLDVEMPVLGGPEMAQRLIAHNQGREKIPLLLLSAVMDLHLVAERVGTPYYLSKPYELDHLLAVLDRALEERSPPRPSP